jgi:ATP synthase protein I
VPGPSDEERRTDDEKRLSNLASGYQKAAPYMAASTTLVVSVALFTFLGHWLDGKLDHHIPWMTIVGSLIGMAAGFTSFFRTVLGKRTK